MTTEKIIHFEEDMARLLAILPNPLNDCLTNHPKKNELYEIVMDLGHPPSIRFDGSHERLTDFLDVTQSDIHHVVEKIGAFNSDNRAGIERALHRISAIRNRQQAIVGLSIRVGRAVIGAIDLIQDIVSEGKNLLILGPPGVGKTTKLREAARFLSTNKDRRVMIVDSANEIGGEGDIPHPGIGYARRMQVLSPELQDKVMIEAVENHTPQVIIVDEIGVGEHLFSEHFSCPKCEISFEELQPRGFSFNSPFGACTTCDGLGTHMSIDEELVVPDSKLSLIHGCIKPIGEQPRGSWYGAILKSLSKHYGFNFTTPWRKLDPEIQKILLYGTKPGEKFTMEYQSETFSGTSNRAFEGVIPNLQRRYTQTKSGQMRDWIEKFMTIQSCPDCKGARLKKSSLAVFIGGKNIVEVTNETVGNLYEFFNELESSPISLSKSLFFNR